MSDSDNYFSDSDKSNNEVPSENEEDEELSEYEMDDDTRMIIYNAMKRQQEEGTLFRDITDLNTPKPKKKDRVRKVKEKRYINLTDVNQVTEEVKPKKWMSKRLADKKKELGIKDEPRPRARRKFNPRLPPPNKDTFKKKEQSVEINMTEEMFPTLGANLNV